VPTMGLVTDSHGFSHGKCIWVVGKHPATRITDIALSGARTYSIWN
jgi:hypothetical protein